MTIPDATTYKTPIQPGFAAPHKIDRAVFGLRGRVYVAEHDGLGLTFLCVDPVSGKGLPASIHRDALREAERLAAPAYSMAGRAMRCAMKGYTWAPGHDGDYTSQRAACIEAADAMRLHLAVDVLRRAVKPGAYQASNEELDQLLDLVERSGYALPDGLEAAVL